MKANKRKIIIIILGAVLIILLFIIPFGVSAMIYEDNFGNRYEKYEPMARSIDEFEELNSNRYTFASDEVRFLLAMDITESVKTSKGLLLLRMVLAAEDIIHIWV